MQQDKLRDFLKFFRFHLPWFIISAGFFGVILISGIFFSTKLGLPILERDSFNSAKPEEIQLTQLVTDSDSATDAARLFPELTPILIASPNPESPLTEITPPSETIKDNAYTVLAGDTLWSIAEQYYQDGTKYSQISQANNLKNANSILIGQRLIIPPDDKEGFGQTGITINKGSLGSGVQIDRELAGPAQEYTIAQGDCLWKIALKELGDPYRWVEIYQLNQSVIGSNPDLIYPDVVILVPSQ